MLKKICRVYHSLLFRSLLSSSPTFAVSAWLAALTRWTPADALSTDGGKTVLVSNKKNSREFLKKQLGDTELQCVALKLCYIEIPFFEFNCS